MQVFVQLVLLATPNDDLADRLEATWAVDPAAADEAVDLLVDDPRLVAIPTLQAEAGELASLVRDLDEQAPEIQLVATPIDTGVAVALEIARPVDGDLLHYAFEVVAEEARFTAVQLGDLTVLVRPLVDPEGADLDELAFDGRDPELRPRARRRAIDTLLVD